MNIAISSPLPLGIRYVWFWNKLNDISLISDIKDKHISMLRTKNCRINRGKFAFTTGNFLWKKFYRNLYVHMTS